MTITGDNFYNRGDQLQLNCSSEGGPVLEYTWTFSGDTIANANTDTLIIDNVNTTHAGDYTCNVTNDAGTDSDTFTVYSKSPLYCMCLCVCVCTVCICVCVYYTHMYILNCMVIHGLCFSTYSSVAPYNVVVMGNNSYNQGEQLQLNCSSEGGLVLEYTWFLSGGMIPNANTSTLTIDNVNTTHAGDYTCNVTNIAGNDSDTITVYSKSPYSTILMGKY